MHCELAACYRRLRPPVARRGSDLHIGIGVQNALVPTQVRGPRLHQEPFRDAPRVGGVLVYAHRQAPSRHS